LPNESAQSCAERLAREKARVVARQRPQDLVLGADTVVVVNQEMLGKPRDPNDAERMLSLLAGRTHQVITGVCLAGPGVISGGEKNAPGFEEVRSESTLVTMMAVSRDEILSYIASGEPMDKAGAYAIQGVASRWISRIEGDYCNVVGLPIALLWRMLREDGWDLKSQQAERK
jgi:septum formation protein